MNNIAAIILAAGKGTRLRSRKVNKVMLPLNGKPMLSYTIQTLKKSRFNPLIIVVGFAKKSITDYFKEEILYAFQKKRLGTAHAVSCGLQLLPKRADHILIVNGDDSYLYTEELLKKLVKRHLEKKAEITLLTVEKENPHGLGRIVRNKKNKIVGIVEEKDATIKERQIREINPQCWIFKLNFLKKFLKKVKKSRVTGEYYLTDLIDLAIRNKKKIEDVKCGKIAWRGVNTILELCEAKAIFKHNP